MGGGVDKRQPTDPIDILKKNLPELRSLLVECVATQVVRGAGARLDTTKHDNRQRGRKYETLRLKVVGACKDLSIDYPDMLWMSPGLTEYFQKIYWPHGGRIAFPHPIEAIY